MYAIVCASTRELGAGVGDGGPGENKSRSPVLYTYTRRPSTAVGDGDKRDDLHVAGKVVDRTAKVSE